MDQKSVFITIAILIVVALSGTASYSFIKRSSCSDINAITAFLGNQMRVNMIYVAASNSAVQKFNIPKSYSIEFNKTHLIVEYTGFCKISEKRFVLRHDLQGVKDSSSSSSSICIASSINNCKKNLEICNSGEECCTTKQITCGNGKA